MEGELSRSDVEESELLEEVAQVLSHDLENYLMIAQGSLELARREPDEEHFERTAAILENSEQLVDDLVTLARTGRQCGNVRPTELGEVCDSAWVTVAESDASFELEDDAEIRADASSLRLLLENLFQNAVEHGRSDATVRVGTFRRPGAAGFYVADDGDGFSADEPDRAFETGYTTADEQTGLGLSIVRRIAEAHGWTVSATESRSGGARFEFSNVDVVE